MTHEDLLKLTYDDLATYSPTETVGIGKLKGIRFRKATVKALDAHGRERYYLVQANTLGETKILEKGSVTREQLDKENQQEWLTFPDNVRSFVELNWPALNLRQKNVLASMIVGKKVSDLSICAVIGGAARHRFQELFPNVTNIDQAKQAMRNIV